MRVMVTGSDGYIGRGVLKLLLERGHTVDAYGFRSCELGHERLNETIGDVFEHDFSGLDGELPDVLLHLAWRKGFNHSDMAHLDDLPKHYRFLKSALDSGISRIAVMGSMHEVGYFEGEVRDDSPCNPTTLYGVAKNSLRQLSVELCRQKGAVVQWLRGFYLVSNDGRGDSIFSKIVRAGRSGQQRFPFTSGTSKYDFLPYGEFCAQVVAAIEQCDVSGIINICSGTSVALGEYIEAFIRENGFNIELDYGKYPDRPYDSPAIWGDATKINSILASQRNNPLSVRLGKAGEV